MVLFLQFLQGLDGKRNGFAYLRIFMGDDGSVKVYCNGHITILFLLKLVLRLGQVSP